MKRVLIVDDDPGVRKSIGRILSADGYEVLTAADGAEAVKRFAPGQTDLVLLDLDLPALGGWEVFERLTAKHPLVPVIIITGMPHQYRTAAAAGAGALMEKPIDAPALLKVIADLLAEPAETRLRRLGGYGSTIGHFEFSASSDKGARVGSAPPSPPLWARLGWARSHRPGRGDAPARAVDQSRGHSGKGR